MYTLNEGELIDSFQSLLNDLESLSYASYICELIDIAVVEDESNRHLFKDFITVLYLMQKNAMDYEVLARAFEVKLIAASGYSFGLDNCSICRKRISTSDYFNFDYLGGICGECSKTGGVKVSYSTYNALRYLTKTPIENVYRLSLTQENKQELNRVLSYIIVNNFGRKPNSLETLNFLKGVDNYE
jgi:DNA repair protein RecO (recombination protein O)